MSDPVKWRRSEWMTVATWISLIGYLLGFTWYSSQRNTMLEQIVIQVSDKDHGLAAHEFRLVKVETSILYQEKELDAIADAVGAAHKRRG